MSSSLFALLSQQTSNLQTRKGLILLGLQNDFLSPDGKLPVSTKSGFLDRLKDLVQDFREFGDVIWVRSEFEASRDINAPDESGDSVIAGEAAKGLESEVENDPFDPDEELFLTKVPHREPCCLPGTYGAEYATQIKAMVDPKKDMQVVKTFYSAFSSTSLLLTLRSKLITELFVCGCNTNLSVFATAMDAARYGIKITLVEDCLGYRRRDRHEEAIRQLREIMEADMMTSDEVIDNLRNPVPEADEDEDDEEDDDSEYEHDEVVFQHHVNAVRTIPSDLLTPDSDGDEDGDELDLSSVRLSRPPSQPTAPSSVRLQNTANEASITTECTDCASLELTNTHHDPISNRQEADGSRSADGGPCVQPAPLTSPGTHDSISVVGERHDDVEVPAHDAKRPDKRHDSHQDSEIPSASEDTSDAAPTTAASLAQQKTCDSELVADLSRHADDKRLRTMPSSRPSKPEFGADKEIESEGSRIYYDLLPAELSSEIFDQLLNEVDWQRMRHQTGEVPRLVCCQGTIATADGSKPIYRHPSDQVLPLQTWTNAVEKVRKAAEDLVGHTLNHALIQLYRNSIDYISEHSDKTLDIVPESHIVNVSFGAQRTMRLRTKRVNTSQTSPTMSSRTTHRIPLPHNSMLSMSLATNAEYLHGINADKRPRCELNDAETAFEGQRISLTFRHIGTFLSADEKKIWGQGAVGKTKEAARPVINSDAIESEKLILAFGKENQASSIMWEEVYGVGSDVLNLK